MGHPGSPELQVVCAPVCSPPFLVPLSASAQPPFAHRARSTQFLLSLSLEPTLALSEVLGPVTTLSHRSVSRFLFSHSDRLSPYTQRTVTIVHGRTSRKYCCHWATAEGVLRSRSTGHPNKRLPARTLASPCGPKDSAARSEPLSPVILSERRPTTKHTTHVVVRPSSQPARHFNLAFRTGPDDHSAANTQDKPTID